MASSDQCAIGLILERRECEHPWQDHEWVSTGVTTDVTDADGWTLLYQMDGVKRFLSPSVALELHASETEAYLYNLGSPLPSLFLVLREDDASVMEVPFAIHLITASPYEAQDYMDSSEEHVDRIAMDEGMKAWVERFVSINHQEQDFKKRKRDKLDIDEHKFGQEPLHELRRRGGGSDRNH